MRILIILLLIILTGTACTSQQAASPITHPIPIAVTSDTPVVAYTLPGTSISECKCPTSMVIPAQSQDEVISYSPVICNCPAIIIQLPAPTSQVESNPPAIPINGITLADSGKTFSLHPGESFLLNFDMNAYDWVVTIYNQKVLSRVKNVMVIRGAQGVYMMQTVWEKPY